ncbi:MAG: quinolinate synthase NadA [Candidatus Helarchaeota archaeon]
MDTPQENVKKLQDKILKFKEKNKFVILAHNYQLPEVQQIADFVADSLQLAKAAQKVENADNICFAAVKFMAEGAAILNPNRKVFLPDMNAICPMAAYGTPELLRKIKENQPNIPIMLYINSTANAKIQADYIVTSANAVKIAKKLGVKEINFSPDSNLGQHVQNLTDIKINPIPKEGHCYVHKIFSANKIIALKKKYPEALVLVHPECTSEVREIADYIGSTSQMEKYAKESNKKQFIIGTETAMLYKMKQTSPEKDFIPADQDAICKHMKLNTLEKILHIVKNMPEDHIVTVPDYIAEKTKILLNKMIELS